MIYLIEWRLAAAPLRCQGAWQEEKERTTRTLPKRHYAVCVELTGTQNLALLATARLYFFQTRERLEQVSALVRCRLKKHETFRQSVAKPNELAELRTDLAAPDSQHVIQK